jgi:hypothetical protein
MSDINIITDNLEDNLENIPESGEYAGAWNIPLNEILANINTYLNLLKNNDTEHTLSNDKSLMSDGEVGLWSEKLLVDVGNNSTRHIVTCDTLEPPDPPDKPDYSSPVLSMTDGVQEILASSARPCLLHMHKGDKNHFYKVSNPEVINNHSIFPDYIDQALDKALPYLLLHYALGNTGPITEDTLTSCFKDIEVTSGIKKTIVGLVNYLNAVKAGLHGDKNNIFFTKQLDLTWSAEKASPTLLKSYEALDYKSAENRFYYKNATYNDFGVVRVGKGLKLTTDNKLYLLTPYDLTWEDNIKFGEENGLSVTVIVDDLITENILTNLKYDYYCSIYNTLSSDTLSSANFTIEKISTSVDTVITEATFTGLTPGVHYYFMATCRGIESPYVFYSSLISVTVPSFDFSIAVHQDLATSLTAGITVNSLAQLEALQLTNILYNFYCSTHNTLSENTLDQAEKTDLNNNTGLATFTGLTPSTTYYFIASCTGTGSTKTFFSQAVSQSTLAATISWDNSNISSHLETDTSITVTVSPLVSQYLTDIKYKFYKSIHSNLSPTTLDGLEGIIENNTTGTAVFADLNLGTPYYFMVSCQGTGSNEVFYSGTTSTETP